MLIRSLQWRLVTIFLLLVTSVMMVVSIVLISSVEDYYYESFIDTVRSGVQKSGITSMQGKNSDDLLKLLGDEAGSWFGIHGSYGNWMIVDRDWNIITTEGKTGKKVELSKNLITAMGGKEGYERNSVKDGSFDYAVKITLSDGTYLLYIKYPKTSWGRTLTRLKWNILVSTVVAVIVSFFLGYILSKTITVPIQTLTGKAKKIAAGDFDQVLKIRSSDEIGQLANTFNHMARELKSTLNEISSEKSKIETILQYMTDGVIAFNFSGEIIHANPAAVKMLNLREGNENSYESIFRDFNIGISIEEITDREINDPLEKIIETDEYILKAYFAPFVDKNISTGGIMIVLQDITQQHKLDTMRKEFVANVSHELRTPLTTIKSYVETLLDGEEENPETRGRFLNVINAESERMTRLVKDLLQLSRIDYDRTKWVKSRFDLNIMVYDAVEKMKINAEEKQQIIETTFEDGALEVTADKDRVEQVILNIISNSIKYTDVGGKISVSVTKDDEFATIAVRDNGIGIPKEDLPRIFERFYRVDKARSREMGGTGLGLSIAKEIMLAHGGDIIINSELGQGTEVIIRVPIKSSDEAQK